MLHGRSPIFFYLYTTGGLYFHLLLMMCHLIVSAEECCRSSYSRYNYDKVLLHNNITVLVGYIVTAAADANDKK